MEIKRDADVIASNAVNDDIVESSANISESSDISVDITDLKRKSILRSFSPLDWRLSEWNAVLISLAQENRGEFFEYSRQPALNLQNRPMPGSRQPRPMQSLVYVKLANEVEIGEIAVIIHAVISPVNATVTTLRYQLYFISGIMILLAVILAIIIAKRVSKPIEEINHSAMSLASGNYDTRFSGKGFYEIVALSETMNIAAEELGKVEGLRRELLANVSHDLRTPLSLIYSYAEMMFDFPDEITPDQTRIIMDETRRLATLVNDVLDISKLEADMERLDISYYNLTEDISETTERVKELLKIEGFQITFDKTEDVEDIYVNADEPKMSRVFYNLLINAINYSGDNRIITVTQTVLDGHVRISVKDSGEGIAPEELPFIWDRYYKSGKKHRRAVTGSGLGLSIVKKIVELHGGRCGVQSELGIGSVFWFEIMLPKPDA
jgi:signal transduction histidine kinase